MSAQVEGAAAETEATPRGLWRNGDFVKLWLGMNVSFLGTQVSSLAYPLTAVLILHAGTAEMNNREVLRPMTTPPIHDCGWRRE